MRSAKFIAALAASCLTSLTSAGHAAPGACGSGYHADASGACQPDVAEVNRYCPAGQAYHASPNGYYCETPETPSLPQPVAYSVPRERKPVREAHPAPHRALGTRRAIVAAQPGDQPRSLTAPAPLAPSGFTPPPVVSGGGGGGGGGWSDRRLKRDIERLGVSPSGLPIYSFQYVWGGPRYIGVMAQDLLKLRPDAVILDESGFYKVDYALIDVEMREETISA